MTAEPPDSPVRSLEVRWIFPGQLEAAVAGWFARFPAAVPMPGGVEPGLDEARSYAEWLGQQPRAAVTLSCEDTFSPSFDQGEAGGRQ